jgi:putative copper export protein
MLIPWGPAVGRLLLLAGYTYAMGALVLEGFVLPRGNDPTQPGARGVLAPFYLGLAAIVLASTLMFALTVATMSDGSSQAAVAMLGPMLGNLTGIGGVLAYRGAIVLLIIFWRGAFSRRFTPVSATILGLLLAFSLSIDGHGAHWGRLSLLSASDALHALFAASWLGGLILLWLFIASAKEPLRMVQSFSRVATVCFPGAVLTGLLNAFFQLKDHGGWNALFHSPYGLILLGKTVLVGAVLVLAGFMRQIHLPGWERSGASGVGFRKFLTVELVGGVLILMLTSLLTQTSPPHGP